MISESPNSSSPLSRKSLSRTRQPGSHADPASESTEGKKRARARVVVVLFVGVVSGKNIMLDSLGAVYKKKENGQQ